MAKKNKGKEFLKQQMAELQAEERAVQKKRRALMAACSHTDGKNFTIDFGKKGQARCRRCNSEFSVKSFNLEELAGSIREVYSAIQQVRMLADVNEDSVIISELGKLGADVLAMEEIYKRHLERYGKNNNNNRNKNKDQGNGSSQYGSYGYTGIIATMEDGGFYGKKNK